MEQPSYYAIIPANVRYADISSSAKLLYGEITALASKEGYCWASNEHFATLYNVKLTTISEWVKILSDKGFIRCVFIGRNLRHMYLSDSGKTVSVIREKPKSDSEKAEHSIKESITKNTSVAALREVEVVSENGKKPKSTPKYPHSKEVFALWGAYPKNWALNTTQLRAAENLYEEQGIEEIKGALEFYQKNKEQDFCPQVTTPYDLDSKWAKLEIFYDKKHA